MLNYRIDYKNIITISTVVLGLSYKFPLLKYFSILLFLIGFYMKNKLAISRKDLLQIPQINIIFIILFVIPGSIIVYSFDYYLPNNFSFVIQASGLLILLNQVSRLKNKEKLDILRNLFLGLFIVLIFIILSGDLLAVKDGISKFHGGFGNRLNFSLFTSFSSVLSLALLLSKNIGNKFKLLLFINSLFTFPLTFLTFSRTGIYSLVGALSLTIFIEIFFKINNLLKNKSISKKSINIFSISFLILIIARVFLNQFFIVLFPLLESFNEFNQSKGFLTGREIYIEKLSNLLNAHPQISIFGVGGPDYLSHITRFGFNPLDTGGLVLIIFQHGIFFLLLFIITCIIITLKLINQNTSLSQKLLLSFILVSIIAPSGNFFTSLHVTHTLMILFLQALILNFNTFKNIFGGKFDYEFL